MTIMNSELVISDEIIDIRRDLHIHPEIGLKEFRTSDLIASKLTEWGIEVTRIADTGVVGTLRNGNENRSIGIRADIDALPITEESDISYKSKHEGFMHACGHDGHTAILLAAAQHLSETKKFNGTVHLIFQPGEEGWRGAAKMISDGLFTKFPCDAIYGLHNDPNAPLGTLAIKPGVVTAATARFWIDIEGRGSHASRPQDAIDPVYIGALIVVALQSIVSRRIDPLQSAVVSATQFHAGSTGNVIPGRATINGTIRALDLELHERLMQWAGEVAQQTAALHGAKATISFEGKAPPTLNAIEPTAVASAAAEALFGKEGVINNRPTEMGGEDFAEMSQLVPACYVFAGQAVGSCYNIPLHHPEYNFNDALLPVAAALWVEIVQRELPAN